MILVKDHHENLRRVDHKIEFSRPPQLSLGTKEKRKCRDKHMRRNTMNRSAFTGLEKH